MRRWFLSYNSQDLGLMQGLEGALKRKDPEAAIFSAPKSLRVGGFWLPELAKEIAEATIFLLLVGEQGLGPWQVIEYYEALDRRVKQHDFPIVLVLLEGQPAPGLPFLRQLHWIISADPASEKSIAQVMDAAAGASALPGELWRHTAPYRGLAAMTEADTDFFFGRGRETVEVIRALEATPEKLPVLLGNSGVGKSSLAQAGVLAAFMRQAWPETAAASGAWPQAFTDSRGWCVLTLKPGTEPVRALVEPFFRTWQFGAADPERAKLQSGWIGNFLDGAVTLRDLLDATELRYRDELHQPPPTAFLLYIDQGEELYVRAEERQRRCFSNLLAEGLADPRLRALMSLRADFFGELLNDEPLQDVSRKIEVPPLREAQLNEVVSRPAALLSARFETNHLAHDIAKRAAEESTEDAGALPLLSYLLDDMWQRMVERGDGLLRLPAQSIELGRVLVQRADAFLARNPKSEADLRRILTLKLATVREDGEPTRRRAFRSEFSDEEWRLVSELADHPSRLLITATPEAGETYAEVAHEAIFRRWDKLREWIAAEREFLAWRSGLEVARRAWQGTPDRLKNDALLMGLALTQAQVWFSKRSEQVAAAERNFIMLSRKATQRRRRRIQALVGVLSFAVAASLLGWMRNTYVSMREEREFAAAEMLSQAHTYELERNLAKLTGPTLSELKRLGDATVFIKNKWYLHDQITQKQLFQRMDRINGELLPCFVRMDDGSVVRWLTLDDQGGLNTPVGVDQGGSGFVVAETGLIVTNKRYAAGWTMPYEDYPANGPWRGAVYPILKSDQQAVTTLDSRDLDMSGMVTKWVPSSGGYVFEPSRPNPISSGLRQFSGQNDLLTVQFSESRIGIDANLQRIAIDADLAVLKIQTTQPLSTLEFMDGDYQAEVGEKVFLLSYEPSQETVVSDPIVTVGMVSRISSKKDEGDYQFASLALPRSGGGPVLNSEGKVIGILISPGGDAHGAFAVRADYVRELFKPVSP